MKNLLKKYSHAWVMGYILIYLPWFFYLESAVTENYSIMHVALDDYIPFSEYFIVPYLFWFAYVAGAVLFFFFTSKSDYYRLCTFLFVGMTVSLLVCTFFPNGTDLRVAVDYDKNIFTKLVGMIHASDTSTNVFPSIHAFNSLGVYFAIRNSQILKEKRWLQILSFVSMTAICLSTVVLKQHSVIDVAGAFILGYGLYPFVFAGDYALERKRARQKLAG